MESNATCTVNVATLSDVVIPRRRAESAVAAQLREHRSLPLAVAKGHRFLRSQKSQPVHGTIDEKRRISRPGGSGRSQIPPKKHRLPSIINPQAPNASNLFGHTNNAIMVNSLGDDNALCTTSVAEDCSEVETTSATRQSEAKNVTGELEEEQQDVTIQNNDETLGHAALHERLKRMEDAVARSLLHIRALQQSRERQNDEHRLCQQETQARLQTLQDLLAEKDKHIRQLSMELGSLQVAFTALQREADARRIALLHLQNASQTNLASSPPMVNTRMGGATKGGAASLPGSPITEHRTLRQTPLEHSFFGLAAVTTSPEPGSPLLTRRPSKPDTAEAGTSLNTAANNAATGSASPNGRRRFFSVNPSTAPRPSFLTDLPPIPSSPTMRAPSSPLITTESPAAASNAGQYLTEGVIYKGRAPSMVPNIRDETTNDMPISTPCEPREVPQSFETEPKARASARTGGTSNNIVDSQGDDAADPARQCAQAMDEGSGKPVHASNTLRPALTSHSPQAMKKRNRFFSVSSRD